MVTNHRKGSEEDLTCIERWINVGLMVNGWLMLDGLKDKEKMQEEKSRRWAIKWGKEEVYYGLEEKSDIWIRQCITWAIVRGPGLPSGIAYELGRISDAGAAAGYCCCCVGERGSTTCERMLNLFRILNIHRKPILHGTFAYLIFKYKGGGNWFQI